jgi:ribosomal protein S12 methylthiotransferase
MQVYLESLGCARNQVDSESMLARLMEAGGQVSSDPADADVIVVNTCCFIESATDEAIDTILALAAYKKKGRCRRLIVT